MPDQLLALPHALRVALESDIPFLDELRRTTMRPLIENHYAWHEEEQRARILSHFECARIITLQGRDIGLLKVVHEADAVHLSQIQILPAYQGQRNRQHPHSEPPKRNVHIRPTHHIARVTQQSSHYALSTPGIHRLSRGQKLLFYEMVAGL